MHIAFTCVVVLSLLVGAGDSFGQSNWTLLGWNNLGMHCMDSDYSVFSILPPYNTVHAQLINDQGRLVTNVTGIGITYHAVADADGSFNATSRGKGNFWQYAAQVYGVGPAEDVGLPVPGPDAYAMPGTNNAPQAMHYDANFKWFAAYGVPITPYDDAGKPNQYPMMRITATNSAGQVLASTDIVLPVSDEMDCKLCHASGSGPDAEPGDGWVWDGDPGRDYRLNILRLHDERHIRTSKFRAALAAAGFHTNGLYDTVTIQKRPILCATCHLSEALPGTGMTNIPPLTTAMHGLHANVVDPRNDLTLDASENRVSCYSCHPGSVTRCLRGAMGKAVAPDGSMQMQCQSCHGGMSDVGSPARTGWLEEPNCQACHVGGANNAFGTIRFLDAMTNGVLRVPADTRFATTPNSPAPGVSLYRFSAGHGGLQCSACHGSTHAEFPSALPSDNVQSRQRQGHAGVISECTACHAAQPNTVNGGPHGMHPVGQSWVAGHRSAAEGNLAACRVCHGMNDRGTVLSRSFSDRSIDSGYGTKTFWQGYQIGCYTCHDGPSSENASTKGFPVATNVMLATTSGIPVGVNLGTERSRIVSQAGHGIVAISNTTVTYFPDPGFIGQDLFTFCVTNDYNDSNLATGLVTVLPPAVLPLPVSDTHIFAFMAATQSMRVGFATTLGNAYLVERSDALQGPWSNVTGVLWGHTDSTYAEQTDEFSGAHGFFRSALLAQAPTAQISMQDSATNSTYDGGWVSGSNGGTGWGGGWLLSASSASAGHFVSAVGAANLSIAPRAWGLWANTGATAEAVRVFASPLMVGQTLGFLWDNNWVSAGSSVGFALQNAAGQSLFEFSFVGGEGNYRVNDDATGRLTRIPWSGSGWDIRFQRVADDDYVLACGGYSVPGRIKPLADRNIVRLKVWNAHAGSGSNYDLFFSEIIRKDP